MLRIPGRDAEDFSDALPWFPFVGAVYGLTAFLLAQSLGAVSAQVVAALILVVHTLLSGGLHLDGVADAADGLGGGRDRTRSLEIMKDSRVGAFGVMAVVLDLLLKWSLYSVLVEAGLALWFIPVGIFSRALQVELMVCLPYARSEGTAGVFVERAGPGHRVSVLLVSAVSALFFGIQGIVALVVAYIVARVWGIYVTQRVGGITGDLLGVVSELVELSVALFAVLIASCLF